MRKLVIFAIFFALLIGLSPADKPPEVAEKKPDSPDWKAIQKAPRMLIVGQKPIKRVAHYHLEYIDNDGNPVREPKVCWVNSPGDIYAFNTGPFRKLKDISSVRLTTEGGSFKTVVPYWPKPDEAYRWELEGEK